MPRGFKNVFNHDFFEQDSEESFYWAGFIAADGCLLNRNSKYSELHVLQINLSNNDHDHLKKLKTALAGDFNICIQKVGQENENRYISRISLCSKKIFNSLARFEIEPRKTHTSKFPKWLKENSLARHFLRGYFDGDGGFYLNKNKMTIRICGTIDFLNDFKEVLEKGSEIKSISIPYMYNGQGALNYSGNVQCKAIANYLYTDANIYLDRKFETANSIEVKQKITPSTEEIANLYRKYWSTSEVAKILNYSQSGIALLIRQNNMQYLYEEKFKIGIKVSGKTSRVLNTDKEIND